MNKELLIKTGEAAFGNQWQTELSQSLNVSPRAMRYWVSGERQVPNLNAELIALLNFRKVQIDNAISDLNADAVSFKRAIDLDQEFYVVNDNGHVYDEQFATLADAQAWVNDNVADDDLYLVKYHKMTLAEQWAIDTINDFLDDDFYKNELLKAIQNEVTDKPAQEVYKLFASLDDSDLSKAYFKYYIAKEFSIGATYPGYEGENFDDSETMTFKQFVMKEIANLCQVVANL